MAFEQLVYQYDRKILSIALSYTGNAEDAKDMYQEVLLRVHRALPRFRFESRFSTWLYRVTANVCLSHRSKRSSSRTVSLDEPIGGNGDGDRKLAETIADGQPGAEQQVWDAEVSGRLKSAMKCLSPQQRMVFVLRHYHGYKLREIASLINCAEGTVKKYLFTATERMRHALEDVRTA